MKHIARNNFKFGINMKSKEGFTLMEVIVALGIFAAAASLATASFALAVKLDRQGTAHRAVRSNAIFVLEVMGKEIRNGTLDYASYGGTIPNSTTELNLLMRGSERKEKIYFENGQIYISREIVSSPGTYSTSTLTNNDIVVDSLSFYISPENECVDPGPCTQERVTVVMKISSNTLESGIATGKTIDVQTSFTTRIYDL